MLDIPEDIAELIVNEASVSDDGTSCIKSCALISKKFLAPSRKHLFRKVQLKDIVQYARFQSAVASSPSIATHVHEFSTEDPSIIDDPAFPALLGSFLNIMKLDLCFDHLHIPVYSGPGSTPGTVPPRIYWQNLELVLQDVLDCILRAPILERLAIRGICDIPQRYIMSFLDIPFLTLDNSSFAAQNPDIGLTPKASGNYRLQNLTLSHIQIAELQPFIKILSLIKFRLETLHVLRVDLEIAQKIIDIQRSSIVHLDIDRLLNGSDDLPLNIGDLPNLSTVRMLVHFFSHEHIGDILPIVSSIRKGNKIREITIVAEYSCFCEVELSVDEDEGVQIWQGLDRLLSDTEQFTELESVTWILYPCWVPEMVLDHYALFRKYLPELERKGLLRFKLHGA